jgi:serine/threonine protein kinase
MKTFISPKGYYYKISKNKKMRISKIEYLKYNKSGGSTNVNTKVMNTLGTNYKDIYKRKDGSFYYENKTNNTNDKIELGTDFYEIRDLLQANRGHLNKSKVREFSELKRNYMFDIIDAEYKRQYNTTINFKRGTSGTYFTIDMGNDITVGVKRIEIKYNPIYGSAMSRRPNARKTVETRKREIIMREILILKRMVGCLKSVQINYYCNDDDDLIYYIVMEHVVGTVLSELPLPLNESRVQQIARNMVIGLKEIKDKGVTHRDISINNILVLPDNDIKFIDFGGSCRLTSTSIENNIRNRNNYLYQQSGTHQYWSPEEKLMENFSMETLNDDNDFYKRDIWSFGIILHQLLYGDYPLCFKSQSCQYSQSLMSGILTEGEFNYNIDTLPYNKQSKEAFNLVYSILNKKNPSERPGVETILADPFLAIKGGHFIKKPKNKVIKTQKKKSY